MGGIWGRVPTAAALPDFPILISKAPDIGLQNNYVNRAVKLILEFRNQRVALDACLVNDSATSLLKFEDDNPFPTVSQPERILWSSPKSSSRLLPRAKCSMILYMSSGFLVEPACKEEPSTVLTQSDIPI